MSVQLTFGFTPRLQRDERLILQNEAWLDVSDIACGVGFTTTVQISNNLIAKLRPGQNEVDADYDQRLYDALWITHFKLSLDQSQSALFNFTFSHKDGKAEKVAEICLRPKVESQKHVVWLGWRADFRNE
jgi:hypothetical protein